MKREPSKAQPRLLHVLTSQRATSAARAYDNQATAAADAAMRPLRPRAALPFMCRRALAARMSDPVETPRRNLTGAIVPALALAGLAAVAALVLSSTNNQQRPDVPQDCIIENADAVGGPIDLVDASGARVTQADFAGEPAVVYFGFTNCPDICPTSMYSLGEALALPGGFDVRSILITVDPGRDTPARMGEYVRTQGFPPGLVGLSGQEQQVQAAISAFRVYARRAEPEPGAPADIYNVDHSSLLYVLDGQWRTVAIVPTMTRRDPANPQSPMGPVPPETIAACISAGLERAGA
jgi:protein SCO1/2